MIDTKVRTGGVPRPEVPQTLPEAVDRAWLTAALAGISGGARVASVDIVETIKTMASKVRIAVRFEGRPDEVHNYCLKAFLDGDATPGGGATTIREINFYRQIAPLTTVRVPRCLTDVVDLENSRAILVMEDLIAAGAHFCSALEPFSVEQAADSLEQLARLHATPGVLEAAPWLHDRMAEIAGPGSYFTPEIVQPLLDDPRSEGMPAIVKDAPLLFRGVAKLAEWNAASRHFALHGDCHAGNIYLTGDGLGFTDWQLIERGNWAIDVAYNIGAILPVEVAEREERRLLDHYLDCVRRFGGTAPDPTEAWEDYRAAMVYGFFQWAITRRVDPPIIREFIVRLGSAVVRLDSYGRLGL